MSEVIDTTPCYNNIVSPMSTKAVRLREWIRTNGTGFILTDFLVKDINSFDMKIKRNVKSYRFAVFGVRDNSSGRKSNSWCSIFFGYNDYLGSPNGLGIDYNEKKRLQPYSEWEIGKEYHFEYNDKRLYVDGLGGYLHDDYTSSFPWGIVINGAYNSANPTSPTTSDDTTFSAIEINGEVRLHPAELALPYENHPIGECCMIDLNSGDLYFNQGSGQFTCEGAVLGYWQDKPMNDHYCDVEGTLHRSVQIFADNGERLRLIWEKKLPWTSHRWLTQNNTVAYCLIPQINLAQTLDIEMILGQMNSTSNYSTFGYANVQDFHVYNNFFDIRANGMMVIRHIPYNVGDRIRYNILPNKILEFTLNGRTYTVEDAMYKNDTPTNICLFALYQDIIAVSQTTNKIRYFKLGNLHLTPAVLDRPTLAEEDNNNIARKQGECVFVDEERYKQGLPWVFGNVASSGSFSVSDYLIEGEDYEKISGVEMYNNYVITNVSFSAGQSLEMVACAWTEGNEKYITYIKDFGREVFYGNGIVYNKYVEDVDNRIQYWAKGHFHNVGNVLNQKGNFHTIRLHSGNMWDCDGITNTFDQDNTQNVMLGEYRAIYKSFKIDGVIDLIPVRLLRNIETTCTHNGKGGKANEIGFFDTISGKFFGNDGSGEFSEYIP